VQINSIELFHLAIPLLNPPAGQDPRLAKLETVLVRVDGDGKSGWGEAAPGNGPLWSGQWAAGAFVCLKDWLAPAVVGKAVDDNDELRHCFEMFQGNQYAKAAVDMAWWDLTARLRDVPLAEALGGTRPAVEVGTSLDQMESIDDFLAAIGRAFEAGFARVDLKLRPGWDLQMLGAVREQYPVQRIHVSVDGGMRLDHMEILCRLDDFSLEMVEQPLAPFDLVGHAMVQETIRTSICLSESITSLEEAELAIELESCRSINVSPGRVGGLTTAAAIHDACRDSKLGCWVGSRPQTAVGTRATLSLASKEQFNYPADFISGETLLEEDVAESLEITPKEQTESETKESETGKAGEVRLWSEAGIGIEPDMDVIEKYCICREKFS